MIGIFHLGREGQCPRGQRLAGSLGSILINEDSGTARVRVYEATWPGKVINLILLLSGRFETYLHRKYALIGTEELRLDSAVCHDLLLLPVMLQSMRKVPIVFDAREYYPAQFEHSLVWRLTAGRLNQYICRNYLAKAARVVTVSRGIAGAYERNFGVQASVISSYADFYDLEPVMPGKPLRLVHHGNGTANRRIENMILAMDDLGDGFSLDLYIVPKEAAYYQRIRQLADARPNVTLKKPVPFDEIVPTLNAYDIGLFVPPASTFNLKYSMPNKVFEFLQARLMIVVSPLPELRSFVEANDLGDVTENATPAAVAQTISRITRERVLACKTRANALAQDLHSGAFTQAFRALLDPDRAL